MIRLSAALTPKIDSGNRPFHLDLMESVHATCVAVDGVGVMLRGPSGSGKSDLALRLIDGGAMLVADDQVRLSPGDGDDAGRLVATAPPAIAGIIEIRGLGPMPSPNLPSVPVALLVDMKPGEEIERLPEPAFCTFLGCRLPLIALDPFRASAPAALRFVVAVLRRSDWPVEMES